MKYKIEICADTVESAMIAQNAGADRVELCAGLPEGGTTPSHGCIASARANLKIALHVMIRPRGGDFLYSDLEVDVMRRDIDACRQCGADGIVLGLLTADGSVDVGRAAALIEHARPMAATFHRAFDLCRDPMQGLEDVIAAGASRLLTSGHKASADEGAALIKRLVDAATERIIIMAGAGVNESNVMRIASATGAREFHLTAAGTVESEMTFKRTGIALGGSLADDEYSRRAADGGKIERILRALT